MFGCVSGEPRPGAWGVVASTPSGRVRRDSFSIPRRMPLPAEIASELSLFSGTVMSLDPDTQYQLHVRHFQSCSLSPSPLQFVASKTKGGRGEGNQFAGRAC